jgi:hypothetical protein
MAAQDFSELMESGLLTEVEQIVVQGHRELYARRGRPWSPPIAYHWLGYENPDPVGRLSDGVKRLRRRGAQFGADAVDKACANASEKGFLN